MITSPPLSPREAKAMTPERIKELRAVIAKATPGPLVFNSRKEIGCISSDDTDQTFGMLIPIADALSPDDAEAIVSACNNIPSCLDTIESQAARIVELEAALEKTRRTLLPFAGRVFNDNGDMTVDIGRFSHDEIVAAYWAERSTRAALTKGE